MPLPFIVIPCLFLAIYFFGATTMGNRMFKNALKWVRESWAQSWSEFKRYYRTRENIFDEVEDFKATQVVFSADNKTAIAIDSRSEKVCLLSNPSAGFPYDLRRVQIKVMPYLGILEAALHEDGNTITKTSRSSQLVGAVVGNVLLGGAGMVVGVFTGAKKSTGTARSLEVRLTIKDMEHPYWAFTFLRGEVSKNSKAYQTASNNANRLLGQLKVVIDQAG